jgi:hypothetical protein
MGIQSLVSSGGGTNWQNLIPKTTNTTTSTTTIQLDILGSGILTSVAHISTGNQSIHLEIDGKSPFLIVTLGDDSGLTVNIPFKTSLKVMSSSTVYATYHLN